MSQLIGCGGVTGMPISGDNSRASGNGMNVLSRTQSIDNKDYIFARAVESIPCYSASHVDVYGDARALTASNSTLLGEFAVAIVSCSPGDYSWFQTKGLTKVLCIPGTGAMVKLYTSDTPGLLDDATASAQAEVLGIRVITPAQYPEVASDCFLIMKQFGDVVLPNNGIFGFLSLQLEDATLSGIAIYANIAGVFINQTDDVVTSAAGTVSQISAAAGCMLDDIALTGAASVSISGTLAVSLDALTVAGQDAGFPNAGVLTATLDPVAFSAAGSVSVVTGALAVNLADDTLSAVGVSDAQVASMATTLAGVTGTASGTVSGAGMSIKILDARYQNPAQTFTDTSGVTWKISPAGLCVYNGTPDATTSQVVRMVLSGNTIYQQNYPGNWYSKAATSSPVAGGWSADSDPRPAGQAMRVMDLVWTFGANLLTQFAGGPGPNATAIFLSAMSYLGVKLFREQCAPYPGFTSAAVLALANAGYKGCFHIGETLNDTQTLYANIMGYQISDLGGSTASIFAFEGINEPNNTGGQNMNASQIQTVMNYQGAACAADARINGIIPNISYSPWVNGTTGTDICTAVGNVYSRGINWGNWHAYCQSGNIMNQSWPNAQNGALVANSYTRIQCPGQPFLVTEFGCNPPGDTSSYERATGLAGGKMLINAMLDNFYNGAAGSFLFCLFYMGEHFELFNNSATPYPAATVIHNFTTIVNDAGATARSFSPGALAYSITGLRTGTTGGRQMVFQRSDGAFILIIWDEPAVQNSTPADITPTTATATITINQAFSGANLYDPVVGTASQQNFGAITPGQQISVGIAGYPKVVILTP